MTRKSFDAVVIGGGFYGCLIALFLKKRFSRVAIVEKEEDLLLRASYNNQARIHRGYHYPRSFLTAFRSRVNYTRFTRDFNKCIYGGFKQYYAIAAIFSKTTTRQFVKFCRQIEAPLKPAQEGVKKLFNPSLVEEIFEVEEEVYDAGLMREFIKNLLEKERVKIFNKAEVVKIEAEASGKLICFLAKGTSIETNHVYNCAYSNINQILAASGLTTLAFKHELIEMPIIKVPGILEKMSVTIMDGPFFGILPFPDKKAHSLWHVRYAVHDSWIDNHKIEMSPPSSENFKSNFSFMIKDAQRYLPALEGAKLQESIYEVKTVLIQSEQSDARPILFYRDYGMKGLNLVLGSKIDNIYDVISEIQGE